MAFVIEPFSTDIGDSLNSQIDWVILKGRGRRDFLMTSIFTP